MGFCIEFLGEGGGIVVFILFFWSGRERGLKVRMNFHSILLIFSFLQVGKYVHSLFVGFCRERWKIHVNKEAIFIIFSFLFFFIFFLYSLSKKKEGKTVSFLFLHPFSYLTSSPFSSFLSPFPSGLYVSLSFQETPIISS